jgi:two-component system OmpR family sensor kinase
VINRSLAPIERARRDVARRAADDFSPLSDTGLPDEVRPLVDELNLLFSRVRSAFDAQKNFVADAAHELRSPLTALKLQAQALRQADHGHDLTGGHQAAREADVARLNQGIDRAIRLVEQLLTLARAEASTQPVHGLVEPFDLTEVIQLAVADVLPQAHLKHIDLGLSGDTPAQPVLVNGQSDALRMMLRNLLDNAVKYTPASGQVDVSLRIEGEHCVLSVEDSGPGIAPDDRARVFDRFFRATDVAHETGSGLGLAIVKVIAAQHGAAVTLEQSARLGGLLVQVRLNRSLDLTAPMPATRH